MNLRVFVISLLLLNIVLGFENPSTDEMLKVAIENFNSHWDKWIKREDPIKIISFTIATDSKHESISSPSDKTQEINLQIMIKYEVLNYNKTKIETKISYPLVTIVNKNIQKIAHRKGTKKIATTKNDIGIVKSLKSGAKVEDIWKKYAKLTEEQMAQKYKNFNNLCYLFLADATQNRHKSNLLGVKLPIADIVAIQSTFEKFIVRNNSLKAYAKIIYTFKGGQTVTVTYSNFEGDIAKKIFKRASFSYKAVKLSSTDKLRGEEKTLAEVGAKSIIEANGNFIYIEEEAEEKAEEK